MNIMRMQCLEKIETVRRTRKYSRRGRESLNCLRRFQCYIKGGRRIRGS
ncbi:hypothetical protein H5410_022451 [Solanum commersonii]|uniref:Uncharacterized protein n=1 Tax=Solanum commersonii TaxID=4109 RepID=A0A9J5ZET6_SOLCO|nr:hypothetical protein H5410_022451 [Solanum commersonii]